MPQRRPYHEVLGVRRDAPPDEVKRVYRDLVKKLHPDQFRDEESARMAENELKEVNAAWSEY
jgi:molecular chaperone DnaJ